MNRVIRNALTILFIAGAISYAYAQSVQYKAAEGYMPETIIVKRTFSDKARLCVEPAGGGLLTCKTVGEVRWWFLESTKK